MSEAGSLPVGSWVFLGQSLYSVATVGVDAVTLVHNCPDGTQRLVDLEPHDEVEPASERLESLRRRVVFLDAVVAKWRTKFDQYINPVRREMAFDTLSAHRAERDELRAQVLELEALGIEARPLVAADRKEQANG